VVVGLFSKYIYTSCNKDTAKEKIGYLIPLIIKAGQSKGREEKSTDLKDQTVLDTLTLSVD
jgi:pyocin large subunit-like protein